MEDYAINQIVALEFLSKWKVELDIAENGVNALEKFKTKKYDIILMDLQMPEMDGYETTRRIRMLEKSLHKKTPIIALTASAISEIRNRIMEAGMDDYISKPVDPKGQLTAGSHFLEPGAEPVMANDGGWLTSKVYSPHLGCDIALGYLKAGDQKIGKRMRAVNLLARTETEVEIVSPHFFDPEGERLRG